MQTPGSAPTAPSSGWVTWSRSAAGVTPDVPFRAGAIIALADETATAATAAAWETNPAGEFSQMSTDLIRRTNGGTLVADAETVDRGRPAPVVDLRRSDVQRRPIATRVATLLTPAGPGVTARGDHAVR
jgi:hypothetical protein